MKNLILLLLMVTVQMGFTQPLLIDDLVASSFGGYNISCNGATDGSIDLTVSGGILPYSFLWSNGLTSEDITGLAAGIYTVTVTDGAAVTQSASITLTEPDPLFVPVSALTYNGGWNVSCYNASDGFINLVPSGGVPNYSFNWSNGATTEDLPNVSIGTYTVTVTDANGCTATNSITLDQPTELIVTSLSPLQYNGGVNISCFGLSDGSIDMSFTGGTSGYNFLWSNSATTEDINTISAGTYTVTVTDDNNCVTTASITLLEPFVLSTNLTNNMFPGGTDISCNGLSDGSINQTATGGTTVYTYQWSSSQTSEDISGVAAGTYTVTVTDANGCTASTSITLTQPPVLSNGVTSATYVGGWNISCNGMSNGTIDQSVTGGTSTYTYQWSSGQTSEDISSVAAGTYTVTVTDANGCTASTSITLTEPPVLSNNVTAATYVGGWNISCNGLSDGSINQTATGGTTVYTYQWSSSQTSEDISGVAAGTYTVTVTDANGCTASTSITLTQPPVLSNNVTAATYVGGWNISCNGLSDGSINQTATGGTTVYTYQWSSGQTSEDISSVAAGTYTVTVTDANGCTASTSITLTQPPVLSNGVTSATYVGGWNISCNGMSNGTIDQSVTGGTSTYTYQWSSGQTSEDISGVAAGTYTVTVTDANGCTASTSITLTQPPVLSNNVTAATYAGGWNISCNGLSNGSINQTATGGTTVYTYQWSSGQTSEDISGVAAGTYTVTVTDANGCTASTSITLTEPPVLSNNVTAATYVGGWNISCNGLSDGSINQTATGGTTVYTYQWSSSQTSEDISGVAAGTYTVTVTDANGCTASTSITLTQPPVLSNNVTAATYVGGWNISCNGLSDGSINQTATGGTTVYTYQWSSGQTSEDISSVAAGTYTVTVTDANGCTASTSITLTQPPVLSNGVTSATYVGGWNISCNGLSDGSINQTATGGTTVYTYQWSSGQTSEDISDLAAGTYTVTVTDANGCTASTSITLTQPPVLSNNVTAATYVGGWNISCNGLSDGSINQTATGGTTVYTYQWSSGQTSEDISSVAAGTYTVTMTDANGCTASTSITLTQPPVLSNNVTAATYVGGWNISCNGLSDGSINQTATGGTTVYTYQWSSGQTSEDISSVAAGTYTVTVTDANGCTASTSITLTQPPVLSNNVTAATYVGGWNISCNGLSDGSINQTATGGTTIYTYQWSSGQTSEDISSVAAGTYTVTVTDANGCTASTSITLTQPPVLSNNVTAATYVGGWNISCNGLSDGSINQTATGGTTVYTYQWSSGQTSEDISGVAAGTYTVTVTDANGCTASTSITLTQPPVLSNNVTAATYVGGWNISCNGLSDGSINQTATGGTTVYTYQWSSGQTSEDISGVAAGTYTVTVTDANGCTASTSITLTQPPVLSNNVTAATYAGGWNISCNGLSDGSINQTATGGTTVYTYQWSSGQTSEDISSVAAGTYTVTVTDANGCTASTSITLTQPPVLSNGVTSATYVGGWNISCNGMSNGTIDQSVTGGTSTYTYQWSSSQTSEDISGVAAGTYTVTVTDANGCTASTSITLTQPTGLFIPLSAITYNGGWNVTCYNGSDGFVNLVPSGGTINYQFNWSNGQTTEDISGVAADVYTVTVTDANGCTATNSITLTQPSVLQIDTLIASQYNGGVNISCQGLYNGSIDAVFLGGTPGYTYQWSNGATSEDINGLAAGTYTVTVTDANGCTKVDAITLIEPDAIVLNLAPFTYTGDWHISCYGFNNGSIDLQVTGGSSSYSFNWSNGFISQNISNLTAGSYAVVVTDANGCTNSASVTLNQPLPLFLSATVNDVYCNGIHNGSIDLTVTGGQANYSYNWSTGEMSDDIFNLGPGNYTVDIVDQNGCDTSYVFTLVELFPITTATYENHISCYGAEDGTVSLIAAGGTQPYSYQWNTGDTTQNISNLPAGAYTYTVTDQNNCTHTDTAFVLQPDSLVLALTSPLYANGYNISVFGGNDGSINSSISGGTPEYTYYWSTGDTTKQIMHLTEGTYYLIITDANGCQDSTFIILLQPNDLEMPNAYSPNGDGFNDFFIVHGIEAYPNNIFTVVNRWGNVVYEKKNYSNEWNGDNNNGGALPDGTYFVILDISDGQIILKSYVDMRRSK